MISILSLWLPILLSAIAVFIVSSFINVLLPWHRNDWKKVPAEADVMSSLRGFAIPPGDYVLPHAAGPQEMNSDAYKEKVKQGPLALITIMDTSSQNMAKSMVSWFVYCIVISILAAYIATRALTPAAEYLEVFRFTGATAFIGYAMSLPQNSIWFHRSWGSTVRFMIDGLIYGLLTAGFFGWLWPEV